MMGIIIFASIMVLIVLVLGCLCLSEDFLLWASFKDDPEWEKFYKKNISDFLRIKHGNKNNKNWGS